MARNWISFPRTEGEASRQAHCDLPPGTFERELGREGFFGPATHMYHRHPPTGWRRIEGDLLPRAFDTTKLGVFGPGPWSAFGLLSNAHVRIRTWETAQAMDHLARNADGDELLFIIAQSRQEGGKLVGPVVGTLMSNLGLEHALKRENIEFERARVGDRYVMEEMRKRGAVLGGEERHLHRARPRRAPRAGHLRYRCDSRL